MPLTCSSLSLGQLFAESSTQTPLPSFRALSKVTFCERPAFLDHLVEYSSNATPSTPPLLPPAILSPKACIPL